MKKLLWATSLLLLCITTVNAQRKAAFEGVIIYDMSFDNSGLPAEALSMLKGSTITVYIKGNMRRSDTKTPMSSTSSIEDGKNKTMVSFMDLLGKKYMIKMNEAEAKKQGENIPVSDITYSEETKIIAGYKCKKAEVGIKNGDKTEKVTIFYTDELPASDFQATYKGLKGVPMEYSIDQNGIKVTITASKISKESVPDSKFALPEGYTETTIEELQKNIGQ